MTIPTQHNCPHSPDGWCLACIGKLAAERDEAIRDRDVLAIILWKAEPHVVNGRDNCGTDRHAAKLCHREIRGAIDHDGNIILGGKRVTPFAGGTA